MMRNLSTKERAERRARKLAEAGDISVVNHGSILIFLPTSDAGREWIAEHIASDAMRWAGGVVVEPRYAQDIVDGAIHDGMEVKI
jgi:hypothetical protein